MHVLIYSIFVFSFCINGLTESSVAPLIPCIKNSDHSILPIQKNQKLTRFFSTINSFFSKKKTSTERSQSTCSEEELNTQDLDFGKQHQISEEIQIFLRDTFSKGSGCIKKDILKDLLSFNQAASHLGWEFKPQELYNLFYHIQIYRKDWHKAVLVDPSNKKNQIKFIPLNDVHSAVHTHAMLHLLPSGKIIIAYGGQLLGQGSGKVVHSVLALENGNLNSLVEMAKPDHLPGEEAGLMNEVNLFKRLEKYRLQTKQEKLRGIADTEMITLELEKEGLIQKRYAYALDSWIDHHSRPSIQEVQTIGRNIGMGLQTLHRLGYVHGDIKASNVLLDEASNASLTDLGLTYHPEKQIQPRTTYSAEAPEALKGIPDKSTQDPNKVIELKKRDVYGLGILLSELCLHPKDGRQIRKCLPSFNPTYPAVVSDQYSRCVEQVSQEFYQYIKKKANEDCPSPSKSDCLYRVIAACVHPDPSRRLSSDEFIELTKGW